MTTLERAQEALNEATIADDLGDFDAAHSRLDDAMLLLCRDLARPGPQNRAEQTRLARELVEEWGRGERWTG